jgi:hypothetical protein
MCDKLVFDLSQEVEGSPNVFIRKDWINILDNQNQNYQNNQSIIDTSQLSNSNKYMGYREAYLAVPLLLSVSTPNSVNCNLAPGAGIGAADYAIGLKNWFGQIIHSFTLDYNGTTIIQQTPFINMWNTFKLLTTLSYGDVITQGPTIGFYPDTSSSWYFQNPNGTLPTDATLPVNNSQNGLFVCNNDLNMLGTTISSSISSVGNRFICSAGLSNSSGPNTITETGGNAPGPLQTGASIGLGGNVGLTKRISWINYNPAISTASGATYNALGVAANSMSIIWKSYISQQVDGAALQSGKMQISVLATIYLKHICGFFNMVPLLKGVFMKLTMNLNNASSTLTINASTPGVGPAPGPAVLGTSTFISAINTTVPVGGVNPLHIPSFRTGSIYSQGATSLLFTNPARTYFNQTPGVYYYNLSVGAIHLGNDPNNVGPTSLSSGQLSKSIYLYVPAYTFNPVFEEAYLSNPIKQIKYTDVYQYQVVRITQGQQFNNLITNGIANIKSVLILPFYSSDNNDGTTAFNMQGMPAYQSPFDCAGTGCTSPMITLGNFNIQISGQNAIYNTQRYTFEEFNNQLYGQNAVNGGLTDGLTSGLIGYQDFLQTNCFYYVNVERMLPVEQSVPKSVQIIGTNYSTQIIDLWVFVEYGVEINIDLVTGARV